MFRTTKNHADFWANRKIDWNESYLKTWNHPHRAFIIYLLRSFPWRSLMEVGCGPGPNLVNIVKNFPGKQIGGVDINEDAIALASKTFNGGFFKVGTIDDIMMSDKSVDVVLSDMALIYMDDFKINKALLEMKRISRSHVLLCEFHTKNIFQKLKLLLSSGYWARDYEKLLQKHGFYDIQIVKITPEMWPGGEPQKTFGYYILAKVQK